MDIRHIEKPLTQFVQALPKSLKVDEVIVFGSYLHGNATEDSDIDILVVSDDFESMSEDQRLDMLYDAVEDIDPEIEPWGFTPNELQQASRLTTLGYARDKGIRFIQGTN